MKKLKIRIIMKMTRYMNLLSRVAVLALLPVFAACTDEVKVPDDNTGADSNAITFSIFPESAQAGSRAASDETHETHISDGSMINRLYYVIYKEVKGENGEPIYVIDTHYNERYNAIPFSKDKPFTLRLIPNPEDDVNTQYKILCWAQWEDENTGNPYYDISGFPEEIKVSYDDAMNNDEARDAFYASKEFSINDKGTVVKVILERPFAQINVGTSGWDYEGIAYIQPNPQVIKYSKIIIKGAANRLDVLNDRAWYSGKVDNENADPLGVIFNFDVIPAYRNLVKNNVSLNNIKGIKTVDDVNIYNDKIKEEFLKINLPRPENPETKEVEDNGDDVFAEYLGWTDYDYFCASSNGHAQLLYNIYTETFKYMSMSYVLVPFKKKETNDGFTGSTVEVVFDCAVADENGNVDAAGIFADYKSVVDLKNVPANRNYRTNIIAADGTGFFMNANEINVAIYSETFADYYKRLAANDKDWNGSDLNGENGSDVNDEYEWPDEDFEDGTIVTVTSENIRMVIKNKGFITPYITDTQHLDTDNKIYAFNFIEDENKNKDITFRLDGYFNSSNNSDNSAGEKDLSYAFDYEFYLEGDRLEDTYYKKFNSGYDFTLPMELIKPKIPKDRKAPSADEDGPLDLKYYPVSFKVKLTSKNEHLYKVPENYFYETEIRVYPIIAIYTFDENSEDEGAELIQAIKNTGQPGSTTSDSKLDEKNHFFIFGTDISAETNNLKVIPRKDAKNNNDRLYEMGDHIYLRGKSTDKGHWLILKNLNKNCKITAKISRDQDEDNSTNDNLQRLYNRKLHINWGQIAYKYQTAENEEYKDLVGEWLGHSVNDTEKVRHPNSQQKTVYNFSEYKIMPSSENTGLSETNPHDVQLYVEEVSHGYYWLILSAPE